MLENNSDLGNRNHKKGLLRYNGARLCLGSFSFSLIAAVIPLILITLGCATPKKQPCIGTCENMKADDSLTFKEKGLLVGLLADSHIQTTQSNRTVSYQAGKKEDEVKNSSLRPVAYNMFSPFLIEFFLAKLINEKVDVILYLGDGSNNGCSDEIDKLFDILQKYSRINQNNLPPIYYVIGNHDYLGRGNTALMDERIKLCNDSINTKHSSETSKDAGTIQYNRPYDKFDLIRKVHFFNSKMANMSSANYRDNYEEKKIKENCLHYSKEESCKTNTEDYDAEQHLKCGCYLAGRVEIEQKKEDGRTILSEIMLADTSDYADKDKHYDNLFKTLLGTEYYGLIGFMSNPQISFFERENGIYANRIVASHYDQHGPFTKLFPEEKRLVGRMCKAFDPSSRNYWFSGHTHADSRGPCYEPEYASVELNDEKQQCSATTVRTLNIGSTIDNRPQATAVNLSDNGMMYLKFLTLDADARLCKPVIEKLESQPEIDSPLYQAITIKNKNITHGRDLFGISKDYRKKEWSDDYEKLSQFNIEMFMKFIKEDKDTRLLKALQDAEQLVKAWGKKNEKPMVVDGRIDYDMEMIVKACIASYASTLENGGKKEQKNVCEEKKVGENKISK